MIEEEGIVVECKGDKALVKTEMSSACKSCGSVELCQPSSDENQKIIEADNSLGASRGERVLITVGTKELLKTSLMMYLFPLVLFLFGVLLGEIVGRLLVTFIDKDLFSAISGFIMLLVAFAGLKIYYKKQSKHNLVFPKITRVL